MTNPLTLRPRPLALCARALLAIVLLGPLLPLLTSQRAAAAPTPVETNIAAAFAQQMNAERVARGLAPFSVSADPGQAQVSAEEMRRRGTIGHFIPLDDGGEVVASAPTSGSVVVAFMQSEPHRNILLEPGATTVAIGVACSSSNQLYLAAQVTGMSGVRPSAPQPVVTQPNTGVSCTTPSGTPSPGTAPPPAGYDGSQAYAPVGPHRVADTRRGAACGCQRIDANTIRVPIAGVGPVPAGATAAALTVTVVDASGAGYATVWPAGSARPDASSVNYAPGEARANGLIVRLANGAVDVYTSSGAQVIVDVNGAFRSANSATAGRFVAINPTRVLDTRSGGRPGAGTTLDVGIPAGVPSGVTALAVNVTLADAGGWGYAVAWPRGGSMPDSSIVNVDAAGQIRAAFGVIPVSPSGMSLATYGAAHVVVDVVGYFTGPSAANSRDGLLVSVNPYRAIDTRGGRPQYPGETLTSNTVPNAAAVVTNVTMSAPWSGDAYVTAFPAGVARPGTSTLNSAGQGRDVANLAITQRSGSGVSWFNSGGSHLLVDVYGYFTGPATA
jgi:hypothetical protein